MFRLISTKKINKKNELLCVLCMLSVNKFKASDGYCVCDSLISVPLKIIQFSLEDEFTLQFEVKATQTKQKKNDRFKFNLHIQTRTLSQKLTSSIRLP